MSDRERLRRQLAAHSFAAWELHIFLDTHPNNCMAAQKLRECQEKARALRAEYEEKYGPIDQQSDESSRWAWIQDPWPWDREANE